MSQGPAEKLPRERLEVALVVVVALAFGASFGWNYLSINQVSYLIPSLRLLDPELFRNDWYATRTTQYHPVFAALGALLLSLDRSGWALALSLTFVVAGATSALYWMFRAAAGPKLALPSYLLLVAFAFTTHTRAPGTTYIFELEFQPSALSSAATLAAAACFVSGRFLASGAFVALVGLFHVNLLVLFGPALAVAHALLGRRALVMRLLRQLGPATLVLAAFMPMLLRAATPIAGEALARHLYLDVRAHHHFGIRDQLRDFFPLVAWLGIAASLSLPLVADPERVALRRLGAIGFGVASVVLLGVAGALFSARIRSLFAWRLTAHAELLLQACAIASLCALTDPVLRRRYGRGNFIVASASAVLLVQHYLSRGPQAAGQLLLATLVVILGVVVAMRFARRAESASPWAPRFWLRSPRTPALAFSSAALLYFGVGPLRRSLEHSNLLVGPRPCDASLYRFMRERTPKDALFLTPPTDEFARYCAERAIVVDWKGIPAIPAEILDWYQRLKDVTGKERIDSVDDLNGYDELDAARMARLESRYGIRYAVVRRGRELALSSYSRVFENAAFVVFDVSRR
jgi:hypothetical protein